MNIILTGDRPTGKLHIGHYVGSLRERLNLQNQGNYEKMFIMIADTQALTDNFDNPTKVRENVIEVMLDYLSIGLDPKKVTFFIQSKVSALPELTMYYMNLVTLSRVLRNPTIKSEITMRGFDKDKSIPFGFVNYPISQAADITAFKANIIPVGDDQLPMIEQAREIVRSFNNIYGETLVEPKAHLANNKVCYRLPGIDGKAKMSKSLNNCIYLSDPEEEVKRKVMMMYTDPTHLKITDPGHIEGNIVFTYLDAFCTDEHFKKYYQEFNNLDELKKQYELGGIGDITIKKFLFNILNEILTPIRERRKKYQQNIKYIFTILEEGQKEANKYANETLNNVKKAIGICYDEEFLNQQIIKYQQ